MDRFKTCVQSIGAIKEMQSRLDPEHEKRKHRSEFPRCVPSWSCIALRTCGYNGGCFVWNMRIVHSILPTGRSILSIEDGKYEAECVSKQSHEFLICAKSQSVSWVKLRSGKLFFLRWSFLIWQLCLRSNCGEELSFIRGVSMQQDTITLNCHHCVELNRMSGGDALSDPQSLDWS